MRKQNIRNSQNKSIGAVPESMLFGEAITDNSVFEADPIINKNSGSADLLKRNMVGQSNKIYSIEDIGDLKRSQNTNSHSIQDLQAKNPNNIIIQGSKDTRDSQSRSGLRRQIAGGPSQANSAIDIKKGGNHATLVVRNQINIINNN